MARSGYPHKEATMKLPRILRSDRSTQDQIQDALGREAYKCYLRGRVLEHQIEAVEVQATNPAAAREELVLASKLHQAYLWILGKADHPLGISYRYEKPKFIPKMGSERWSKEECEELITLLEFGYSYYYAARVLARTEASCEQQHRRLRSQYKREEHGKS